LTFLSFIGVLAGVVFVSTPMPLPVIDLAFALVGLLTVYLLVAVFVPNTFRLLYANMPGFLIILALARVDICIAYTRLLVSHDPGSIATSNYLLPALSRYISDGSLPVTVALYASVAAINFLLLTKGLTRVTEVLARFTLDALPGRQMGIDAEIASGAIDGKTAAEKKARLQEESGFYAAMDGTGKFLRGEIICSIVIALIGVGASAAIIGVGSGDYHADDVTLSALQALGLGFILQVAATVAGATASLAVAKSFNREPRATERSVPNPQLYAAIAICVVTAVISPLLPGILKVIPIVFSLLKMLGAAKPVQPDLQAAEPAASAADHQARPNRTGGVDAIRVEVGYQLVPMLVRSRRPIRHRLDLHRNANAETLGISFPAVRFQDNPSIGDDQYMIYLRDVPVASGELKRGQSLAVNVTNDVVDLEGVVTADPIFGLPAVWIPDEKAPDARRNGWIVTDGPSLLVAHTLQVVRDNLAELITTADVEAILQNAGQAVTSMVGNIVPGQITLVTLQRILQALVQEQVSIRDLAVILEAVQEACSLNLRTPQAILPTVRQRLGRQICTSHMGQSGNLKAIGLSTQVRDKMLSAVSAVQDRVSFELGEETARDFIDRLRRTLSSTNWSAFDPILLVDGPLRPHLSTFLRRQGLSLPVLGFNEVHEKIGVELVSVL
jgi:flagellar biosynthesis protein FlhA